jgi:hypothetical protein
MKGSQDSGPEEATPSYPIRSRGGAASSSSAKAAAAKGEWCFAGWAFWGIRIPRLFIAPMLKCGLSGG